MHYVTDVQFARYRSLKERFDARKASYAEVPPAEKVEQATARPIARSEMGYRRWFIATVIAYLVVIAVSIAAALLVPSLVQPTP